MKTKSFIKALALATAIVVATACEKDVKPVFPTPPAKPRNSQIDTTIKTKATGDTNVYKRGINIVRTH